MPHPEYGHGAILFDGTFEGHEDTEETLYIADNARFDCTANITFGVYVMIGKGVQLFTHEHPYTTKEPLLLLKRKEGKDFTIPYPKVIESDVWLYDECMILPKCDHIARGVIIGARAVVTKPITEEYSIWAGNPARKIAYRFECC